MGHPLVRQWFVEALGSNVEASGGGLGVVVEGFRVLL